ncbi:hypothetical protein VPHK436_0010 [Vibrio phage K436]
MEHNQHVRDWADMLLDRFYAGIRDFTDAEWACLHEFGCMDTSDWEDEQDLLLEAELLCY